MESRLQDVSEPSKISVNGRVNFEYYIPVDLIMEILSRLPAKSITRCRCVSKLWASMLHVPAFTELFLSRSQARPRLLFTCHKHDKGELVFFSSPQPHQYSDTLVSTASSHMKVPFKYKYGVIKLINGLVFFSDERILGGRKNRENVSVICNPSTGQSLVLPEVKVKTTRDCICRYFGYDPVEKQFKVLSITAPIIRGDIHYTREFHVMTVGTKRKRSWRRVECCIPHLRGSNVTCINGVLYYEAYYSRESMIACFDIRSENFCFVYVDNNMIGTRATLMNNNGKLASLVPFERPFCGRRSCSFVLWILQDAETNKWSKQYHVLPPLWKDVARDNSVDLNVVGMVGGNEIVFSPCTRSLPFYVFYYNIERNTIRRVEIQGLLGSKSDRVCTFLNHLEDIKPIY